MDKKSIISIISIFIIPLLAFWGLTLGHQESAVAQNSGLRPQIIKFSSTMCYECKQVEKVFNEILPKYKDKIDYTEVIVDSGRDMENELIEKYDVQLVPTIIMLNSDGTQYKRYESAISKGQLEKCIKGLK